MALAEAEVNNALEASSLYLVRGFGTYKKAAEKFVTSNNHLTFVVGDNEPVVWFWRHLHDKRPVNLSASINQQEIPISMAPSEGENKKNWKKWGSGDHPSPENRWRGVRGGSAQYSTSRKLVSKNERARISHDQDNK